MSLLDGSLPPDNALSALEGVFGPEFVAELRAKRPSVAQ
jgi:hypothetical protein